MRSTHWSRPAPRCRRRLRQAHALTLDEVAAALGVRRATVAEATRHVPSRPPPQRPQRRHGSRAGQRKLLPRRSPSAAC